MKAPALFLFALMLLPLNAAVLISPPEAMKAHFGSDVTVKKRNILLTKDDAAAVSGAAKTKLTTRIYRTYTAQSSGETAGYGVLITKKVRTKDAAVLYVISPDGTIKGIEVVAFNEPPEFIPSAVWLSQFDGKSGDDTLRVGKDIPAISGATMSARSVTDNARLALALYAVAIKKQF